MTDPKLIIDTANMVPAMFGTSAFGVDRNGFQDGNLTGAVQATLLSADWANAIQMEIVYLAENYASGPIGIGTPTPNTLAQAMDFAFINRGPIYVSNTTLTTASQTSAQAALLGGSQAFDNLLRHRTQTKSNISAGATGDIVTMSLPNDSQAFLKLTCSVVQTDALATNYCSAVKYISARNVAGTTTVQDTQTPYFFTAGIAYVITVATALSSVILRVACPAVPAGKKHNAFGCIEMVSCHNAL
jgi:hypothetical protein